jgi:hypothetical protein
MSDVTNANKHRLKGHFVPKHFDDLKKVPANIDRPQRVNNVRSSLGFWYISLRVDLARMTEIRKVKRADILQILFFHI